MSKTTGTRGIRGWAATAAVVGAAMMAVPATGLAGGSGAPFSDRTFAMMAARRYLRSGEVQASLDRRTETGDSRRAGSEERRVAPDLRAKIAPLWLAGSVRQVVKHLGEHAQTQLYSSVLLAGGPFRRALTERLAYLLGERVQHFDAGEAGTRVLLEGDVASRANWLGAEKLVDALGLGVLEQATFNAVIGAQLQGMLAERERAVAATAAAGIDEGEHGEIEVPRFAVHGTQSGQLSTSEIAAHADAIAPTLLDHTVPGSGAHWWQTVLPSAAPRRDIGTTSGGAASANPYVDGDIY